MPQVCGRRGRNSSGDTWGDLTAIRNGYGRTRRFFGEWRWPVLQRRYFPLRMPTGFRGQCVGCAKRGT